MTAMNTTKYTRAPMNAPTSIRWPLTVQPIPFPVAPPPAAALMSGVMMLSVNALINVLNANATTSPTAMTINSPCIRKFLKPRNISIHSPNRDRAPGHEPRYAKVESPSTMSGATNVQFDTPALGEAAMLSPSAGDGHLHDIHSERGQTSDE